MSRIAQEIEKLKGYTWIKIPYLPAIERYIDTGDPASLKKITPAKGQNNYWASSLADALRPPRQWEDEDRRLVHVFKAAGVGEVVWRWLNRQLPQEKPEEDFVAILAKE